MQGYYLYPDIHGESVVFVSDDDLWITSLNGSEPKRLTSNFGIISNPRFSPNGEMIAFRGQKGNEENFADVYLVPSKGGEVKRLTYFASPTTNVAGWLSNDSVAVSSDYNLPFQSWTELFKVDVKGGAPVQLPYGPATAIALGEDRTVIARNSRDLVHWKRYKGGTRGKFWIDEGNTGKFKKFLELDSNLTSPMWIGDRLFFVSDHEGIGNIYSVDQKGEGMQKHSAMTEYYVRNASSDGKKIVFHSGSRLYVLNPATNESSELIVDLPTPRVQRQKRFVDSEKFLEEFTLHPTGEIVSFVIRGKSFVMGNWNGPVRQLDPNEVGRLKLAKFLHTGERVALVSDSSGEERMEIRSVSDSTKKTIEQDFGLIEFMQPSPKGNEVVITNNRFEMYVVNGETGDYQLIDRSEYGVIPEATWSSDGKWLAYTFPENMHSTSIRIVNIVDHKPIRITSPGAKDFSPSFDPDGKYLYYLSQRALDPVYDKIVFDLGYPLVTKPYLVTLRKDIVSPFKQSPKMKIEESKNEKSEEFFIDVENIAQRVETFPVDAANYEKIVGIKGKALFLSFPVEGSMKYYLFSKAPRANGVLNYYDFVESKKDTMVSGISDFEVSSDEKMISLLVGNKLRIVKVSDKIEDMEPKEPSRESGWIDFNRVKCLIEPLTEWKQMFREVWRAMRENYWNEKKIEGTWNKIYERYVPLLDRVSTRYELSDLIREMQGEVGTSHAYEIGGDLTQVNEYEVGKLGAKFKFSEDGYEITKIYSADPSNEGEKSPLLSPGIDVAVGDKIVAVNGLSLNENVSPEEALLNHAGEFVILKVKRGNEEKEITVETLQNDKNLIYRSWVEKNREYVHNKTDGKVGYLHIPDMGPRGYSEFHRLFPFEVDKDGLIVDVRYNGGGHVSELLLEKLARKRIGYDKPRRGVIKSYPEESVNGPMVAITNENAGSDGDIFSHAFKLYGLGPLLGTRTWGGVVGIEIRKPLVDGTIITQPEFAFWFKDVGWNVENYGTDPTIEVENLPQDYPAEMDKQLDTAIEEALRLLKEKGRVLEEPN